MTDKIVLNDLSTFDNSIINSVNENNDILTTAIDNTLSRDGTSPNQMAASLDMNSNRILNLPAPSSDLEPARKIDLIDVTTVSPIVIGSSLVGGGAANKILYDNSGVLSEASVGAGLTFTGGNLTGNVTTVAGRTGDVVLSTTDISGLSSITSASSLTSGTLNTTLLPSPFTSGTKSGSTSEFGSVSGALTPNNLIKADASGNLVDSGIASIAGSSANTLTVYNVVIDYGADPTGATDTHTQIQNAINAASATGFGGIVYLPPGIYLLTTGLTVPSNITIRGAGQNSSFLAGWHTDVNTVVFNTNTSYSALRDLTVYGKGLNNDPGTFGATTAALIVNGVAHIFENISVWGGQFPIISNGTDCLFMNVYTNNTYGSSLISSAGSNWYIRCKIDLSTVAPAQVGTASAWLPSHAYTVGQIAIDGAYIIMCTVAGTSGSSLPTLKNFGVNMVDGGVTWQLVSLGTVFGLDMTAGFGENHLVQCDFSGPFTQSVRITSGASRPNGPAVVSLDNCVLSNGLLVNTADWASLTGCELGDSISVNSGFLGRFTMANNWGDTAITINTGVGVTNYIIANNFLNGGTILNNSSGGFVGGNV